MCRMRNVPMRNVLSKSKVTSLQSRVSSRGHGSLGAGTTTTQGTKMKILIKKDIKKHKNEVKQASVTPDYSSAK